MLLAKNDKALLGMRTELWGIMPEESGIDNSNMFMLLNF